MKVGDRGESGAAFSVRVELADAQLLPHPNDRGCGVASGTELRAGFGPEKVLLRHTRKDTWFFSLGVHQRWLKSLVGPWLGLWEFKVCFYNHVAYLSTLVIMCFWMVLYSQNWCERPFLGFLFHGLRQRNSQPLIHRSSAVEVGKHKRRTT